MNYEETIISKVLNSNVVFIDDKTIKDRYNKPEIDDYMMLDDADNKYNIVSWDESERVLKLKTII
jgi:hypothetical protein